jgi:hypothetical protein
MTWQIVKVLISAVIISFASWLSNKRPALAGFMMALPVATLLALAFSQAEYRDASRSVAFAKSIFYAIPLSLLFFVPFLLAEKLKFPFWGLYSAGVLLLGLGYFFHSILVK